MVDTKTTRYIPARFWVRFRFPARSNTIGCVRFCSGQSSRCFEWEKLDDEVLKISLIEYFFWRLPVTFWGHWWWKRLILNKKTDRDGHPPPLLKKSKACKIEQRWNEVQSGWPWNLDEEGPILIYYWYVQTLTHIQYLLSHWWRDLPNFLYSVKKETRKNAKEENAWNASFHLRDWF